MIIEKYVIIKIIKETKKRGFTMTAEVYVIGNFKGGVSKTKTATMLAYDNALVFKKKTCLVDLDPQANASEILARTSKQKEIKSTISQGLVEGTLENCITPIMENLDLVACDTGFRNFPKYLLTNFETEIEQISVLSKLLDTIKEKYDTIYIDVPPTISEFSDNAMIAADYSIIIFQTTRESLDGVQKYINYQNFLIETFDTKLDVVGILPAMFQKHSKVDETILEEAKNKYGDIVLGTIVTYKERLKQYSSSGITLQTYRNGNYERWDYAAHEIYIDILNEINGNVSLINKEV